MCAIARLNGQSSECPLFKIRLYLGRSHGYLPLREPRVPPPKNVGSMHTPSSLGTFCARINDNAPISRKLLEHDVLMTSKLTEVFGEMIAHQTACQDGDDLFTRYSTLHREGQSATILNATLVIQKSELPAGFMEDLQRTDILFGQLLMNYGISVNMSDRQIYSVKCLETGQLRWGRQLRMLRPENGALLATIEELLDPERALQTIIP